MGTELSLDALVKEWLSLDQNETTRSEVLELQAAANYSELAKRMLKRIEFGTAGLRAVCGAGFALMNDLIVIQTTQGLCEYLKRTVNDMESRGVVIGHDHRHHSERWALLAANVFAQRGVRVNLLEGVPFSVSKLRAACGIMITASHNAKEYNGYKVYWENAVQIISPHDKGITSSIKQNLCPTIWEPTTRFSSLIIDRTQELRRAYIDHLQWFTEQYSYTDNCRSVQLVNTSLHGVGHSFVKEAFAALGLPECIPVSEQQDPDPDFPTVRFPNPEEAGALVCLITQPATLPDCLQDLAIRCAEENGAEYIMAQDPDADRFSAAQKIHGEWHLFTGDELGAIFAARTIEIYRMSGKPLGRLAMVSSTVSSRILSRMAAEEGFKYQDCLTGFKYIGNTALDLERTGEYDVLFGYEEAIGFMFGPMIRDKDGVATAVMFAILVAHLRSVDKTMYSYLQEIYNRYGFYRTHNGYYICSDPSVKTGIFSRLRNFAHGRPRTYPDTIAGIQITAVRDLTSGYDSTRPPDFIPILPLSDEEMITFKAESNSISITLTLRASGTEPKIKYYLEGQGRPLDAVLQALSRAVEELSRVWVESDTHHLVPSL